MINNQLNREWLQNRISDMESTRDDIPFGFDEDGNNELAAFKLALAAMDSEPRLHIKELPVQAVPDEYFIVLNEGQPYDVFADKDEAAYYAADTSGLFSVLPVSSFPQSVRVPDGWKLVPEIPDSHMITAWKDANYNNASLESALRKMLNAAPEPPQAMQMSDEAQSRELFEKWCSVNIERNKSHPEFYAHLPAREQWVAWEACRAAMLNGGKP